MKILVNTPDLSFSGGVAEYLRTLDLDLEPNIDLFCIHDFSKQNVFIRSLKKYWDFFYLLKKYDLVHLHPSFVLNSFLRDAGFIILGRMLGKKVLITMHGWIDSFEQRVKNNFLLRWLFKITYAKVDAYIVLGEIFKNKLKNLGVVTDHFIIGTTLADDSYIDSFDINSRLKKKEKFTILFLSRIEKEKGIYIAIDAFSKLQKLIPTELVIAGDGPELQKVQEYVKQHRISNVNFTGFVSGKVKHQIFMDADIFLFPSYTEGMPIVLLEAMLYGLPVITRSVGAIPDIVSDGLNGFLTKSMDPETFIPFIDFLINDNELYNSMAVANHQKAVNNFTKKHVRAKVLAVYGQIKTD